MAIVFTNGYRISPIGALYDFSSFTFGMGTFVTGAIGPTYQQLLAYYTASATWASNTTYFTSSKFGFQIWTVPQTTTYEIEIAGSRSGKNYFPTTNQWKFVTVTFKDSTNTMKLYVDGNLVDTNTNVTASYTSENLFIGAHYSGGVNTSYWDGYISVVKIYTSVKIIECNIL